MSTLTKRTRDERGVVAVIMALSMVALCMAAAMVIDLGVARDTRRASQNASDAASLAGASALYPKTGNCTITTNQATSPCFTDAIAAVRKYAAANLSAADTEWVSCTDANKPASGFTPAYGATIGATTYSATSCITFYGGTTAATSQSQPTKVRVRVPTRNVATSLARVRSSAQNIPVTSGAEASVVPGTTCALCVLGDINTNNTDFLVVNGGNLAVAGNITANAQAYFTASQISVVGSVNGGQYPAPVPPATTGWSHVDSVPDPFASFSLPLDTSNAASFPLKGSSSPCGASGGQGIYTTISLPNSTCALNPGIYVITGPWSSGNSTNLTCPTCSVSTGVGVTLYIKSTGSLDLKNGAGGLNAPNTGPSAGFVLLADRDATNPITLQGNGGTSLIGKVYAPAAKLSFNGTSDFIFDGGPIVVGGTDSVGNSTVRVLNAVNATLSYSTPFLTQ